MGIENHLNPVRNSGQAIIHLTMLTSIVALSSVAAQNDQYRPAIPFCDDKQERTIGRRLLYITTLDGRLSALDIAKSGKLHWSIPTDPGPLISSSIHRLELTNNGQFVRMIPSLSGGIYKFDGESIDPIPITTENLLSSSAKFSDDLVISGGKETRTYGVSARTGQVLYECSMHGCVNATDAINANVVANESNAESQSIRTEGERESINEHDPLIDDVIVVRRQTQTVRAVESRTGLERWNFSVGQHELNLIKSNECHEQQFSDMDMAILDLDIKVIVPEGIICAFSKSNPNSMLWKYKFDHPIVSGWKIGASDELEAIDMFGSSQWLWDQDDHIFESPYPSTSPSIYLGMYEKQLYIQESFNMQRELMDQFNLYTHLTTSESNLPKIPWRPILASSNSLVIFRDNKIITGGSDGENNGNSENVNTLPVNSDDNESHELMPYDEDNFALSAQSVLNASEYVNGNGFYLYTREDLNKNSEALCNNDKADLPAIEEAPQGANETNRTISTHNDDDLEFRLDDIDEPVKVVILSLWFWWKEIVLIAFTTSVVLLNFILGQRQRPEREIVVIERHIPVPTAMEATESSTVALLGPITNSSSKSNGNANGLTHRTLSESTTNSGEHFTSRFQSDFDLMRCLGRGGFGVVFEAKNKLDDCKYAVKRITLPNKKESRERVMREVKTLANCEHQNIVRYFQAWVETPPPGWQEDEDSKWLAHELSASIQIETPDGTTLPSFESSFRPDQHLKGRLHVEKTKQLLSWMSSVQSVACSSDNESENEIIEENEDDDSCIVFRTESQSLALRDEDYDDECSKSVPIKRKLKNGAVAIDTHSNSLDLSLQQNHNNIDYSQLSDSFQIEFVRSADGNDDDEKSAAIDADNFDTHSANKKCKHRPSKLHLNKVQNNNLSNNNCKALIPALAATQSSPRTAQNKVYLYIQMQLCRKESLRDWLRENKTDVRQNRIAAIFHQIVDAVDYVHLKGLIHRDLKPSNIFFSQDGQIKIGDFGLVTDMSDIPNMITKCGDKTGLPSCARHTQQVGTHLYMSPEQLRGQHYDFKVDIYSLGLIFFELLVYFSTEMERIVTLRDLRVGRYPKEFAVDYPEQHELLKMMLSEQPEERPPTVKLKQQLSNILKLPDFDDDSEISAPAAALAKRLSISQRTFSSSE